MKNETENPIHSSTRILCGRWKPIIMWHLHQDTFRFGELRRAIPAASQKMLTQQLRELEHDGLVHRKVYTQVPPKVEYSLTTYGHGAMPILDSLYVWGKHHQQSSPTFPPELKFECHECS
ncbi:MAG: helix-turn-helix domain-containing protein [Patescibacteria group bacterium]